MGGLALFGSRPDWIFLCIWLSVGGAARGFSTDIQVVKQRRSLLDGRTLNTTDNLWVTVSRCMRCIVASKCRVHFSQPSTCW